MSTTEYDKIPASDSDAPDLPALLEHLAVALRVAMEADPDLPPLLSVASNGTETALQPWLAGAPITALLAWEKQMAPAVDRRATVVFPGGDGDDDAGVTAVTTTGTLHGVPVTATVTTHRNVRTLDDEGRVALGTLRELAEDEHPITPDEMALMLAAANDPEIAREELAAITQ